MIENKIENPLMKLSYGICAGNDELIVEANNQIITYAMVEEIIQEIRNNKNIVGLTIHSDSISDDALTSLLRELNIQENIYHFILDCNLDEKTSEVFADWLGNNNTIRTLGFSFENIDLSTTEKILAGLDKNQPITFIYRLRSDILPLAKNISEKELMEFLSKMHSYILRNIQRDLKNILDSQAAVRSHLFSATARKLELSRKKLLDLEKIYLEAIKKFTVSLEGLYGIQQLLTQDSSTKYLYDSDQEDKIRKALADSRRLTKKITDEAYSSLARCFFNTTVKDETHEERYSRYLKSFEYLQQSDPDNSDSSYLCIQILRSLLLSNVLNNSSSGLGDPWKDLFKKSFDEHKDAMKSRLLDYIAEFTACFYWGDTETSEYTDTSLLFSRFKLYSIRLQEKDLSFDEFFHIIRSIPSLRYNTLLCANYISPNVKLNFYDPELTILSHIIKPNLLDQKTLSRYKTFKVISNISKKEKQSHNESYIQSVYFFHKNYKDGHNLNTCPALLIEAVEEKNLEMVRCLVECGFEVDSTNYCKETALFYAVRLLEDADADIVQYLLENGANPHYKDARGLMPVDLLNESTKPKITSLLKEAALEQKFKEKQSVQNNVLDPVIPENTSTEHQPDSSKQFLGFFGSVAMLGFLSDLMKKYFDKPNASFTVLRKGKSKTSFARNSKQKLNGEFTVKRKYSTSTSPLNTINNLATQKFPLFNQHKFPPLRKSPFSGGVGAGFFQRPFASPSAASGIVRKLLRYIPK